MATFKEFVSEPAWLISFPSWSLLVPLSFALVVAECLQETIDGQMNKLVKNALNIYYHAILQQEHL